MLAHLWRSAGTIRANWKYVNDKVSRHLPRAAIAEILSAEKGKGDVKVHTSLRGPNRLNNELIAVIRKV